jgi:hypothetical protein
LETSASKAWLAGAGEAALVLSHEPFVKSGTRRDGSSNELFEAAHKAAAAALHRGGTRSKLRTLSLGASLVAEDPLQDRVIAFT